MQATQHSEASESRGAGNGSGGAGVVDAPPDGTVNAGGGREAGGNIAHDGSGGGGAAKKRHWWQDAVQTFAVAGDPAAVARLVDSADRERRVRNTRTSKADRHL